MVYKKLFKLKKSGNFQNVFDCLSIFFKFRSFCLTPEKKSFLNLFLRNLFFFEWYRPEVHLN